ncbi:MAG: cobalamin-dependent protein [Alphaproteobacteria bacterium]|uniref:Cobalamin-dependent protein n=1 Tax=Candidatus Nitrobium versatile TaxID=2884831 RepID=A0A953M326_9BACT|nr:cobalamin-dependent protein [Candidatus Nitrobium versatile]
MRKGLPVEDLIREGLTAALRSLDSKCTNEEFNLLEIMLAGRALMAIMDDVLGLYLPASPLVDTIPEKTIIVGTIRGDIHEFGKHIVRMLFKANGYRVIDLGKDVAPHDFVKEAVIEGAGYIGVSSLITLTIPSIREIKEILVKGGLQTIKVIAGGAAIQQATAKELNVDFVAKDPFDALRYLERASMNSTIPLR